MVPQDTGLIRHLGCLATLLVVIAHLGVPAVGLADPTTSEDRPATDFLTFAQGAVPIHISTDSSKRKPSLSEAMGLIDGNPRGFSVVSGVAGTTSVTVVFALPALTKFDRLAVPMILETPSPGQTFFQHITVQGSDQGPDGPWQQLASATLATHQQRGLVTELPVVASPAVRWVRMELAGGIEVLRDLMALEFSEIIGSGSQEPTQLAESFAGIWQGRGVLISVDQEGPTVTGCVDRDGDPFEGTVSGSILRGRAVDPSSGVVALFILSVADGNQLTGVRSDNGAPFRIYGAPPAAEGTTTECSKISAAKLGCGSVIHGLSFDFDSAKLRPDSAPLLQQLFENLQADSKTSVVIAGHTSSEGTDEYNLGLSKRRAQSVVDDLVRRGIKNERIRAEGLGESQPIARNDDESGRAMNRRVEIHCAAGS